MLSRPWRQGVIAGGAAGLALVAAMYLLTLLTGLRPLPQLLQGPVLDLMSGHLFGFLIDTLQHAGKVVEEAGLIFTMVAALAALGALYARLRNRRPRIPYLALLLAAAGWAVVTLVLLPLTGDGVLGLNEGLATPIQWGILFAIYAVLLELSMDALAPRQLDLRRRSFVLRTPLLVSGLALGVLAVRLLPGWYSAILRPPEAGATGPAPEITPVGNFYVVSKNFTDPTVAAKGWALNIHGEVSNPSRLTLDQLRALPSTTEAVTLECISNNVGGELMSTGRFAGVPLRELLTRAGASPTATTVGFRARDGYTESLPLALVMGAPEILVAHTLDGAPLPPSHGFPARMLIPGHYGMKGPKWLEDIEVASSDRNGFWENQGWDKQALVRTTARIDSPRDGFLLKAGLTEVAGVAFSGSRGISAVEISTDGGRQWSSGNLKGPLSNFTWVLWTYSWRPGQGQYTLKVRARDGVGQLQTANDSGSFPSGATGYHTIRVTVSR